MCCFCKYICKWSVIQVLSDNDCKPQPRLLDLQCYMVSMVVIEKVGHFVPGVVVYPCLTGWCFTQG